MSSKIKYKLNTWFTKILFKIKHLINLTKKILKRINKILNNKIIYYVMGFLFIILIILYIWSINDPQLFYRNFHGKYRMFHIYHLSDKILYGLCINILYWFYKFLKYILKYNTYIFNIIKKYLNKFIIVYIVYIWIIFLLNIIDFKTKILSIITPTIIYFVYNIHNYIQQTKENYKKWFLIDSRYFFLLALILLIYTPIFIYFKDKNIAEQLSIYVYYFLVIGVIYEIILGFFTNKKD